MRLLGVLKDAEASSWQELGDIVKKIEEDRHMEAFSVYHRGAGGGTQCCTEHA